MIEAGFDVPQPRQFGPKTGDKNNERDQNFSTLQGETVMSNENTEIVKSAESTESPAKKIAAVPAPPKGSALEAYSAHLEATAKRAEDAAGRAEAAADRAQSSRPFSWKDAGISLGTAVVSTAAIGGTVIGLMWVAQKVLGEAAAPAADDAGAAQPFGTT